MDESEQKSSARPELIRGEAESSGRTPRGNGNGIFCVCKGNETAVNASGEEKPPSCCLWEHPRLLCDVATPAMSQHSENPAASQEVSNSPSHTRRAHLARMWDGKQHNLCLIRIVLVLLGSAPSPLCPFPLAMTQLQACFQTVPCHRAEFPSPHWAPIRMSPGRFGDPTEPLPVFLMASH